ncbi:MAG TPA: SEC-C metal-binding domain-containing protein [Clostridia bacterium]|nr:SEC-C metal-binding domain-containing protein [Clostridia bacterium]
MYGIISHNDFLDLFNSQNAFETTLSGMFFILNKLIDLDPGYCLYEEFIVNDEFEEDDFKDVYPLYDIIKSKPRYTLSKEEFLKYADYDYFEKTSQLVNLENYINKYLTNDTEKALDITEYIQYLCAQKAELQEITDTLQSYDIVLKDMKQVQEFTRHISEVMNNTRLWSNNGHTPKELSGKSDRSNLKLVPAEPVKSEKIGRNDLCPCGSGKKYKKCCGQ